MARMEPLNKEDVPELTDFFAVVEQRMGFLPNSLPLQLPNMIAHIAKQSCRQVSGLLPSR